MLKSSVGIGSWTGVPKLCESRLWQCRCNSTHSHSSHSPRSVSMLTSVNKPLNNKYAATKLLLNNECASVLYILDLKYYVVSQEFKTNNHSEQKGTNSLLFSCIFSGGSRISKRGRWPKSGGHQLILKLAILSLPALQTLIMWVRCIIFIVLGMKMKEIGPMAGEGGF